MPLAAGMDDTSIRQAKERKPATKCDLIVKASWDTGCKIELEMFNLDPETMAELIPWLRERRIESMEGRNDG